MLKSTKTSSLRNKTIHSYQYNILDLFQVRHSGCPTFKTIDFYILLVSLCLQCPVFTDFCTRKSLLATLFAEKADLVTSRSNPGSVTTANSFLKGKYLICEALEIVNDMLELNSSLFFPNLLTVTKTNDPNFNIVAEIQKYYIF